MQVIPNSACNGVEHVPACSQWPPTWLADSPVSPPATAPEATPIIAEVLPQAVALEPIPKPITKPQSVLTAFCPRCKRHRAYRDVAIHDGQSVRRDCAVCRAFIAFPVWSGTQ